MIIISFRQQAPGIYIKDLQGGGYRITGYIVTLVHVLESTLNFTYDINSPLSRPKILSSRFQIWKIHLKNFSA